jgi:energy-converting hydrogenase Eha subunit H
VGYKCAAAQEPKTVAAGAMFTKDILFGMNILSLAGFAVMGLSLTLRRMAQASAPACLGLMCLGTALVFLGLYSDALSN